MRVSTTTSSGLLGVSFQPLHVTAVPGIIFGTSWKAPAKVLAVVVMFRARFCAPVRGAAVLLAAELPAPPLNPSQDPTNGAPSNVIGSSKLGLAKRLAAEACDMPISISTGAARTQ